MKRCGLDSWQEQGHPAAVTIHALCHSDIVPRSKVNEPLRVIAATHDTSVQVIERNYLRYMAERSDVLSRAAVLETSNLFAGDNIQPLRQRGAS